MPLEFAVGLQGRNAESAAAVEAWLIHCLRLVLRQAEGFFLLFGVSELIFALEGENF